MYDSPKMHIFFIQIGKAIQEVSSQGLDKISEQDRNKLFPKSDEEPITEDMFNASNIFQMKPKEIVAVIKSSDHAAKPDQWNMCNQILIDIVSQDVESPEDTPPSIKGLSKGTVALTTFFNLLGINKFPKTMHHVLRNLRTFYIVKKTDDEGKTTAVRPIGARCIISRIFNRCISYQYRDLLRSKMGINNCALDIVGCEKIAKAITVVLEANPDHML